MQCIDTRLMYSGGQSLDHEVVTVPFVPGPSSRHEVPSGMIRHLRSYKTSIDEELYLHTLPRIQIVDGPPGNALRLGNCLTPSMKRRRKCIEIGCDRNRANEE